MTRTVDEEALLARALKVLPQGSLGNLQVDDQYGFIVARGLGSQIWDISGNQYVDYLLGSGPMLLGHAFPKVIEAARQAMEKGSTFYAQNAYAIALAEEIVDAVPCAEQVRFTTSGTEATFQALRIARAFTKREKILKFEGAFHGMHDYAMMSFLPSGKSPFPKPEASSAGIPRVIQETVLIAPFNDVGLTSEIIERHRDELAAVIIEPVQRIIPPVPGFLETVRELTSRYEIPLIFDEVVTGFRLAYGGAQEYFDVTPDMAAIGKVLGGGFPLNAVVGNKEMMSAYDSSQVLKEDHVPQIGTLNGNPVAAAAGIATLHELKTPGAYDYLRDTGAYLRETLQRLLDEAEIPAVVSGIDPVFDVYFTDHPVFDYRSTLDSNKSMNKIFDDSLQENGVFKSPGKFYVGMCHSSEDVEKTVDAFKGAIAKLRSI